jgi:hypothetical protein
MDSEEVTDAGGSPAAQDSNFDDAPLSTLRRLTRAGMGSRGAITHSGRAQIAVPASPASRRGDRDLKALSGSAKGPTLFDDTASQPQPTSF